MAVLVGRKAPDFSTTAVVEGGKFVDNFTLSQYTGQKYVVLFFYPADFTSVCPTEIVAFQDRIAEFEARNVQLIGVSVDSKYTHRAWLQTPRSKGGIEGVTYPLVADLGKTISHSYDVLAGEYQWDIDENGKEVILFKGTPWAYRGLFLIDRQGTVRHQVVNDTALGRSIDEVLRMVDAVQWNEEKGEGCPVDWKKPIVA